MSFTNTPERYGVISAAFHWLSAIIVYGMFALGLWMVTLSYYDGWYHKAPELHKSIGILLMMGLVDSIGQRNSYVKTWGCGGFLNETNIYSRGKSLCF
uniref:cytochrome b n=3 Tax=Escherichia coli TaxID=562 RepID=UPI0035A98986